MADYPSLSGKFPLSQQLQIGIRERQRRKDFLRLSTADEETLGELQPLIKDHLDSIIDAFYDHLLLFEETRPFVADPETLSRLRHAQKNSLLSLTNGRYGATYFEERLRIGHIHAHLNILPQWYIGAYSFFTQMFTRLITDACAGNAEQMTRYLGALNKIIHLDMTLTMESYIHQYNQRLQEMTTALQEHTYLLEAKAKERIVEITARTREMEVLGAIGRMASQEHNLGRLLQEVLEEILHIVEVEWGGVYILQKGKLTLHVWKGLSLSFLHQARELDPVTQAWVHADAPVMRQDLFGEQNGIFSAVGKAEGIQAWISFPLKAKQELIGLIVLASVNYHSFTPSQIHLINTLSQQVGVFIENARLYSILKESERDYREMVENSPHIIFRLNASGEMLFVNQSITKLLGYKPEDFYNDHALRRKVTHPEDWRKLRLEQIFQGERVEDIEIRLRHQQDNAWHWFSLIVYPLRNDQGEVFTAEGIARDITEKKQIEQEMLQSEKLAMVGQLASGLAHEIGTPLGVISGTAELLMMETKDSSSRRELEVIVSQTERITALIRQLLTFARPQDGVQERVDIHECLERSLRLLEYRFHKEQIQVFKSFQADLPSPLAVDNQLEQVFLNILVNAWHTLPQGGTLIISTCQQEQMIVIQFRDTGQGIPPENLSRIFEPFFTTKGSGKGTGLGLSVCQQILRHHGGSIEVESEVGKGSLFTIKLPLNKGE